MEIGIREAKNQFSRLIEAAQKGRKVYVLNRGKRVAEIVPVREKRKEKPLLPGYGMFKGTLKHYSAEEWAAFKERDTKELLASLSEW